MRTTRPASAVALIALAALLAGPVTAASASPAVPDARASARPVEPRDPLVPMVDVRVADFAAEAETLPPQLEQALARDAGLSGAEWLAQAEASAVGVEVVDALRDHIDVRAARLDGLELVVTVGTAAEAAVVESVGARAEIGPAADRVADIEGLAPAADLRGGMPYGYDTYNPDGGDDDTDPDYAGSFRCSLGFNGIDTANGNSPVVLTAGHCDRGVVDTMRKAFGVSAPGVFLSSRQDIGLPGLHVTDEFPAEGSRLYYDHGFIPVTEVGWTPKPEIVTWGGTQTGAPLASTPLVIRDMGPAMVGATLCKSGSTTGWTCGPIGAVDVAAVVGSHNAPPNTPPSERCNYLIGSSYCVGSTYATICVRGGDSGGPAVVGSRAVGITSASTAGATCDSSDIGVFSTLSSPSFENVTDLYESWEPLIGLAAPTLSTGGLNRFESSLSGSLTGASTRHDVSVELDLGGTLIDEVNASGAWSVDIGAVPNGTREYTLQSSWGSGVQTSPTTTGRFLKAAAVRLAGTDRYSTSVLISQYGFPGTSTPTGQVTPGVPVVYLANGATFPDALSAGPAAALEGGPLLLTPSTSLPSAIAAELDRLNPVEIVIVGGTGVVSAAVQAAASTYASGEVTRIGGANRYETSRMIADRMLEQGLATGQGLWVATGSNFPDALSAGAAAASQGVPILLVNGAASSIDPDTVDIINDRLQSNRVYIAGGTGVVSSGIQTAITNLASTGTVTREGGADRFATSLEINQAAHPLSAPEVFLAYGFNFPDALSGSVVAGLRGGPLYITQTACVSPGILEHILNLNPAKVTVFGGTAIVSNNARDLKTC